MKSTILSWYLHGETKVRQKHNVRPGKFMGLVFVFDTTNAELLGVLHDGYLQHYRTGAVAGIAADYLAREDAHRVGILGSGGMARAHAEACCCVRDIERIQVFSPTPANREAFAETMSGKLGIEVVAVDSPDAAVRDVDIIATCTNASEPIFEDDWMEAGQFITNVNTAEMPATSYERADRAVVTANDPVIENVYGTDEERSVLPTGDENRMLFRPTDHPTLLDVIAGEEPPRRTDDEVVLFRNNAIGGIQFTALGVMIHEKARERDLGVEIPLDWILQDVKN